MEDAHTVGEERREASALVQSAQIELGQVDDEGHRGLALAVRETTQLRRELGIGEGRSMRDLHVFSYHARFKGLWRAGHGAWSCRILFKSCLSSMIQLTAIGSP